MKEEKNNKIKFNPYWVYAIIITILLGMSMFGGNSNWQSTSKTNISDFERFLNEGDVQEIIVVNQKLAKVLVRFQWYFSACPVIHYRSVVEVNH